jgi:hypothetical protein
VGLLVRFYSKVFAVKKKFTGSKLNLYTFQFKNTESCGSLGEYGGVKDPGGRAKHFKSLRLLQTFLRLENWFFQLIREKRRVIGKSSVISSLVVDQKG